VGDFRGSGTVKSHHRGAIYTPEALARRLAEPFTRPLGDGGPPLLDPACGEGALLLAALELRGGGPAQLEGLFGIELDPRRCARTRERLAQVTGQRPEELSDRIVCADALDPDCSWPPGTAILANPPWLSFSGRQAAPGGGPVHHRGPGGWPSLQGAFLERIARHCAHQEQPARLLLPGSVLELEGYAALRQAIASLVHADGAPEELGENAFPGVLEPSVLLSLAPGAGEDLSRSGERGRANCDLMRRLRTFPRFAPETFADAGVHTGNSGRLLVLEEAAPGTALLRRGSDLAPYNLRPPCLHLRLDLERGPERRFRISAREHYAGFPILLRQTADRPMAALHRQPTYFRNSLLAARATPGLAPEFLVALLNGSIAAWWHRASFRDARQRSFPQVKIGHLRTQPTPIQERAQDAPLHDEVVRRVQALEPGADSFEAARQTIDGLIVRAFGLERAPEIAR
jgi:hypothetical protein